MSKPKILHIGNHLDLSGYGSANRLIFRDLQRFADVDILYMRRGGPQLSDNGEYLKYITNKTNGYQGIIAMIDPMGFYPNKKISYFLTYEFDELPLPILSKIRTDTTNLCLSFTNHVANLIQEKTGVKSLSYLPQLQCSQMYPKPPNGPYIFYSVGSNLGPRKHVLENILAYLWAFKDTDNVQFLLKVAGGMKERFERALGDIIIHSSLGLRTNLPKVVFEERDMSDAQIMQLHAYCDCYVGVSYGEGISLGVYEAAKACKPIIYNSLPPFVEYIQPYFPDGLVDSTKDIGLHVAEGSNFNFGFDAMEWVTPLIKIAEKMRQLYDDNVRWVEPFDWSKTDATESIINEICEATKKAG